MTATTTPRELVELGVLSHLDHELALTLLDLASEQDERVGLGVAFASWAVQAGHVCADLAALAAGSFFDDDGAPIAGIRLPEPGSWLAALRESRLCAVDVQSDVDPRPLVVTADGRVYLARYFDYERRLARALIERSARRCDDIDGPLLRRGLDQLFPANVAGASGQRRACLIAALGGLSVISGGPGTGKTYTVAKILLLLQEQARERGGDPLAIQLLAPTGKAAQRLGEAIAQNLAGLPEAKRAQIPCEASTIHRALGYQRNTPTRFRHDRDNPLSAEVVVVDEASMVDLALMAKLVDAVHPNARLILLGDKDQLASVEAGAILGATYAESPGDGYSAAMVDAALRLTGDVLQVSPTRPEAGIIDCMAHLTHVHRFEGGGPIARLASAVNAGDSAAALAVLESSGAELELREIDAGAELSSIFGAVVESRFAALGSGSASDKLKLLSSFRFLCAHRRGKFGVEGLNTFVAEHLTRRGLIDARGDWYDGRPVLVTANDYSLDLFNGDVGVIAEQQGSNGDGARALVAYFPGSGSQEPRRFAPGQLPPHDTVFAMSVHKSQGSELDEVALVLPERISPILTRELIYTGITRAKQSVTIYGTRKVLARAIEARVERTSGLSRALWGK